MLTNFPIRFLFSVQCADKAPPSVTKENHPLMTKELRVKQTQMSVCGQCNLTLIKFKIKKTDVTAHLVYSILNLGI